MKITLILILVSLALHATGQKQKVVFVCEHGVAKSVIATSFFNQLAAERGLNYEAVCRATAPDSAVSLSMRTGLASDNIPLNRSPQKLTARDTVNTEVIVTFTSLPDNFGAGVPIEDWSSIQNLNGSYEQRKEVIIKKNKSLFGFT